MDHLRQDLRFGVRTLTRTPGLTATVVMTLAVGIGAATAVFSILQAVLLRPLPYRHADRLVAVWDGHHRDPNLAKIFASYRDFETWRDSSTTLEEVAAITWAVGDRVLSGHGQARVVLAIPATANLFTFLGATPLLGRTFLADDLARGCTVVVAHKLWQNVLDADASIVGSSVTLDDRACTVAGVMPADFTFFPDAADLWQLITPSDLPRGGVGVFGRLKAGVALPAAQAELRALHDSIHRDDAHGAALGPTAYPLQDEFTWLAGRNLRVTLLLLFAAVALVLLIACVNVANLLLGRAVAREREFALRAALGSGRLRLLRQLLTEGLVLSTLGAGLGILLAAGLVQAFRVAAPITLPPGSVVAVDARVLVFCAGLAVLTAVLFGLAPAWRASRADVSIMLRGGGRAMSEGPRRRYLRGALVVLELGGAVVLLAGASLLAQSVGRLGTTPLGFDPDDVLSLVLRLPAAAYASPAERTNFYDRMLASFTSSADVEAAALSTGLLRGRGVSVLLVDGRPEPPAETAVPDTGSDAISPDYFRAMRVPLVAGRWFSDADRLDAPPVAIVNAALVRKYFAGADPIGQRIRRREGDGPWLTIVGVVGNQKSASVYQEMSWVDTPNVFTPIHQTAPTQFTLLLRTRPGAADLATAAPRTLAALDPNVPVSDIRTMRGRIAETLAYPQFRATMLGGFAALALLLAAVGLYGVLAQLVAQRTQEIGIRMALGATRSAVFALLARQALLLASAGLASGILAASWLADLVRSMLYDVQPADATMIALVAVALLATAAVALYVPARRAMRIDPVDALRRE